MARTRNPAKRIEDLIGAGTTVFRRKGFRRTQMSDVAAEMGCSTGTLYNYVDSKEALFEHAVVSGFTRTLPDASDLPLTLPSPRAMDVIKTQAINIADGSGIDVARETTHTGDPAAEARGIVEDFFEFFTLYHPVLEAIESSQLDYPDLATTYMDARRELVFAPWTRWVQARIDAGIFRQDINAEWTVRYLIEMIAWGAWKARGNDEPYDEDQARETLTRMTLAALLKDEDRT